MYLLSRFAAVTALAALMPLSAYCKTYYFSDCQSGAAAACVPGNDRNDGLSPAKPKLKMSASLMPADEAGNVFRFARGGAWSDFSLTVFVPASTKANPTVFEAYTPSWCTADCTEARPLLRAASSKTAFRFADPSVADPDRGYILRSLHLRGQDDTTGGGVYLSNDVDDVLMEDLVVQGFGLGVYLAGGGTTLGPGSDGLNSDITLRKSLIKDNSTQGFLGGGHRTLIEDNTFDNNGFKEPVYDHNIYVSSTSNGMIIRRNTLTRNAHIDGTCRSVALVAHGTHRSLTVENNFIFEPETSGGCWGIALDANTGGKGPQEFSNLVIRGNRVVLQGKSGQGISCSACPNAIIENNHVVRTGESTFRGIVVPSTKMFKPERGDAADRSAVVRNNSLYIDSISRHSVGIQVDGSGNLQETVVSNLIVYGPRAPSNTKCFATGGRRASAFTAFDSNLCTGPDGAVMWSAELPTLAAAKAAGFDQSGIDTDARLSAAPSLANGWMFEVTTSSRTVNSGDPQLSAPRDTTGKVRGSRPDIGATEAGKDVRPAAPSATVAR